MKQQDERVKKIIKAAINHMVDIELYEWPPQCSAFLYQPVRPKDPNVEIEAEQKKPDER